MNQRPPIPRFAIVGHPNKGKSSLVSTLSQDESVAISAMSGTTERNHTYPMRVDGELLYELIDTPGFQRSRLAMQWLRERSLSPADRAETIKSFILAHKDSDTFIAERQLLSPIVEGAGIIYMVDGAIPYGKEYNFEMDILRWTGQPSMALINQIGHGDYFSQWEQALAQYFSIVRTFNAHTADFQKQIQLLNGFSQLREDWHQPLVHAVLMLKNQRVVRQKESALIIAGMIGQMLTLSTRHDIQGELSQIEIDQLHLDMKQSLREIEQFHRLQIEQLYRYQKLERHEQKLSIINDDLFSEESWQLFGLTSDQLLAAGAIGGAATGSTIDLLASGSTFFLGTGIGAILGSLTARFGAEKLVKSSTTKTNTGQKQVVVGPIKSPHFPYVILGRAICHHMAIERRTHAQRIPIEVVENQNITQRLFREDRTTFDRAFAKIRKRGNDNKRQKETLVELIEQKLMDAQTLLSSGIQTNDHNPTASAASSTKQFD
ncbi:MAG: DUF3482 domain-containing protein [Gammaproteobacteria bacterium]|nr:DUF3482 domain-containing protein [Gammaproteobacteria bacterium]